MNQHMEEDIRYVDIGEGISLKVTKDAEFTLVNNETGKSRTFVSSDGILLVDDSDIDFKAIDEAYGNRRYKEKYIRYGFHRWSDFKDGVCRLDWVIYPDGRYFADSDGYGMEDNDEERAVCTIDRNFDIIEPFRPENYTPVESRPTFIPVETKPTVSVNTYAEPESPKTEEISDNTPSDSSEHYDVISNMDIFIHEEDSEYLKPLMESSRNLLKQIDELDRRISSMEERFGIRQFGNVTSIRIGRSYTLVNIENGKSRVLVNNKGRILLNKVENPLGELSYQDCNAITPFGIEYNQEKNMKMYSYPPLKCIYVSKTGISLIELQVIMPNNDEPNYDSCIIDDVYLYEPAPFYLSDYYYCLLDQDFNVVFPVSHLENPREFCDSWTDITT